MKPSRKQESGKGYPPEQAERVAGQFQRHSKRGATEPPDEVEEERGTVDREGEGWVLRELIGGGARGSGGGERRQGSREGAAVATEGRGAECPFN